MVDSIKKMENEKDLIKYISSISPTNPGLAPNNKKIKGFQRIERIQQL